MDHIDSEITRHKRGWNCKMLFWRDGMDRPGITISGSTTLGGTLFHQVVDQALTCKGKLGLTIVNGEEWTPEMVKDKVRQYLKGGVCQNYIDRLSEI